MYEPASPIFVFADDFDVFPSVRDAERHYEPFTTRVIEAVYDAHGAVLTVGGGGPTGVTIRSADPPARDHDAFVTRLRDRLVGLAEARPKLLDERWPGEASDEELIAWCSRHLMRPPTNPPMQRTGREGILKRVSRFWAGR